MSMQKDIIHNIGEKAVADKDIYKGHQFAVMSKRTEKLLLALYLVTGLIKDTEPIKWKLRENAVLLMSDIITASRRDASPRADLFARSENVVGAIMSLLGVAKASGIISTMNSDILLREYGNFQLVLSETECGYDMREDVISDIFDDEETLYSWDEKRDSKGQRNYKGHIDVLYKKQKDNVADVLKDEPQNTRRAPSQKESSSSSIGKDSYTLQQKTTERARRKKMIIDIARKRGDICVKDISSFIPDCSDKTIQRELTALVKDNVLKKEGNKRWSKYFLI